MRFLDLMGSVWDSETSNDVLRGEGLGQLTWKVS